MLVRLVRMTFRPEALGAFLALFDRSAPRIRAFPGCLHLELWQDTAHPHLLSTYSLWSGPEALEAYRRSDLFRQTWAETKPLFATPASAHSHTVLRPSEANPLRPA